MGAPENGLSDEWLALCRRSTRAIKRMLDEHPLTSERAEPLGRGEGGDVSVFIDRAAEDIIFAELDALNSRGHRFTAISEERGVVDFGDDGVRVVIDPIDGSLNAKRGLPHHAVSIAVARGATIASVELGYVFDFGAQEEWVAGLGRGVALNGVAQPPAPPARLTRDGRLELVAVESASPRHLAAVSDGLLDHVHRVRALGTVAVSLCQLAATRVDGMLTLSRCRAVDAAAGQLIVRESGGAVAFTAFADPLSAPLDLVAHSPLIAARDAAGLEQLAEVSPSEQ
jgi:myo-inositol-1(or 4)-monophosphatase